jgi:hypothetical protein
LSITSKWIQSAPAATTVLHFLAQPGEVGREDGRGDAVRLAHARIVAEPHMRLPAVSIRPMAKYQFKVTVIPQYLPDQSSPEQGLFSFAYTITIANTGEVAAQLISRHWIITDAVGQIEEVKGLGVVATSRC